MGLRFGGEMCQKGNTPMAMYSANARKSWEPGGSSQVEATNIMKSIKDDWNIPSFVLIRAFCLACLNCRVIDGVCRMCV